MLPVCVLTIDTRFYFSKKRLSILAIEGEITLRTRLMLEIEMVFSIANSHSKTIKNRADITVNLLLRSLGINCFSFKITMVVLDYKL